jgi:hypothetical protein
MSEPLVLYSTNSLLAYLIARRYYGDVHYVWCSPNFDATSSIAIDFTNPPSSTPKAIYYNFLKDVSSNDQHSRLIAQNRVGISNGAIEKFRQKKITRSQKKDILTLASTADIQKFRPLLFVIPHIKVKYLLKKVPLGERANPLSLEYKIENLPREFFDMIQLES